MQSFGALPQLMYIRNPFYNMKNATATLRSEPAAITVFAEASEVPVAVLLDAEVELLGVEPGTSVVALMEVVMLFCADADAVFMLYEEPVTVEETAATVWCWTPATLKLDVGVETAVDVATMVDPLVVVDVVEVLLAELLPLTILMLVQSPVMSP